MFYIILKSILTAALRLYCDRVGISKFTASETRTHTCTKPVPASTGMAYPCFWCRYWYCLIPGESGVVDMRRTNLKGFRDLRVSGSEVRALWRVCKKRERTTGLLAFKSKFLNVAMRRGEKISSSRTFTIVLHHVQSNKYRGQAAAVRIRTSSGILSLHDLPACPSVCVVVAMAY